MAEDRYRKCGTTIIVWAVVVVLASYGLCTWVIVHMCMGDGKVAIRLAQNTLCMVVCGCEEASTRTCKSTALPFQGAWGVGVHGVLPSAGGVLPVNKLWCEV